MEDDIEPLFEVECLEVDYPLACRFVGVSGAEIAVRLNTRRIGL